jgi:hypothetical protein
VWYEWSLEGYYLVDEEIGGEMLDDQKRTPKRIKYGMSELHNLGGKGSHMVIT